MTTAATLDSTSVRLVPGEEAVVPLQIRNNGSVVEYYEFEVVGVPQSWTTVARLEQGVLPGATTTTTVTFSPPRTAAVPAGELQFGVIVMPTEHPDEAVVPEGVVEVLPFLETAAELVPRTSAGRRAGRHQVAIDNRGNTSVDVMLTGAAEARTLKVDTRPRAVTVLPGEAVFVDVRVLSAKTIWRNAPVTYPFEIRVEPRDTSPVSLQGTYVQGPVLPPWLWKALLALLAAILALVLLWFTVLKPTIRSEAKDAVAPEAQAAQQAAGDAKQASGDAKQASGDAGRQADKAGNAATKAEEALVKIDPNADVDITPVNKQITSTGASPGVFPVPDGSTFRLTDFVVGNPQGDFGLATVSAGGKPLFQMALENFRDLDYHFVSPIVVDSDQQVTLDVTCNRPGRPPAVTPEPTTCNVLLYLGGTMVRPRS